mgnify:CR=1 FL=1
MDLGIRGKKALVCAASKGLGRGCAEALAAEDDEFLRLFIPWLPFETSRGSLTLPEYLELGALNTPKFATPPT